MAGDVLRTFGDVSARQQKQIRVRPLYARQFELDCRGISCEQFPFDFRQLDFYRFANTRVAELAQAEQMKKQIFMKAESEKTQTERRHARSINMIDLKLNYPSAEAESFILRDYLKNLSNSDSTGRWRGLAKLASN